MKLGPITEQYLNSGKKDSKGRYIGYTVGLRNNGVEFYAWVQNSRLDDGGWKDFGAAQRSKCFKSQAEATSWAFNTARVRIEKIQAKF